MRCTGQKKCDISRQTNIAFKSIRRQSNIFKLVLFYQFFGFCPMG